MFSGAKSNFWKGGKMKEYPELERIRKSSEYVEWRNSVYKRDRFTCQICGQMGAKLNADHIKPFALYPELRLEISNGRTLCVECHKRTPTFAGRIKIYDRQYKVTA